MVRPLSRLTSNLRLFVRGCNLSLRVRHGLGNRFCFGRHFHVDRYAATRQLVVDVERKLGAARGGSPGSSFRSSTWSEPVLPVVSEATAAAFLAADSSVRSSSAMRTISDSFLRGRIANSPISLSGCMAGSSTTSRTSSDIDEICARA